MRALIDVNVLLALFDPEHSHHGLAHTWRSRHSDLGWASCPLTENGFVRIISQPAYPRPVALADAVSILRAQREEPGHEFWPDDISITDRQIFDHSRILGPNQLTDLYLLALAVKNGGRLATFDRAVAISAVRGAEARHVAVL